MYIIIVGGGRVGYYLTKTLLDEGHEVLIVEKEANICETINNELGSICLRGDGCETATLAEVGTERADMLVAVTGEDPDNLVACQIAKHKFSVNRTIARIRNPQNEVLFKKLGIDVTVSGTNVILEYIEETFNYDLQKTLDDIRPHYHFDETCQGSVPQSIIAFLESDDYEDAVRKVISLGGDSDTMACIAGGIAQAYYKSIPEYIVNKVRKILDSELLKIIDQFTERYILD